MNHASINQDANKSAHQLLDTLWRGRGFPVDPMKIAEELGVTVLETALPDNVLGGLVKDADKDAVILLNQGESNDHKRFNCAQKIGHYVDLVAHQAVCYKYVDFRVHQTEFGADEVFANYFGAALLMPDIAVRQLAREGMAAAAMAKHFGVTVDAMEYRMRELGLMSDLPAAA